MLCVIVVAVVVVCSRVVVVVVRFVVCFAVLLVVMVSLCCRSDVVAGRWLLYGRCRSWCVYLVCCRVISATLKIGQRQVDSDRRRRPQLDRPPHFGPLIGPLIPPGRHGRTRIGPRRHVPKRRLFKGLTWKFTNRSACIKTYRTSTWSHRIEWPSKCATIEPVSLLSESKSNR